ncbi:MAG: hypothetical protein RJA07_793 [Bacteroidota bacterium]|jgi:hypothetical protein
MFQIQQYKNKVYLLIIFFLFAFFFSCIKEKFTSDEITAITDVVVAQSVSSSFQSIAEQAHTFDVSNVASSSSAAIIFLLDTSHTKSTFDLLNIDFGTSAVLCRDNKYRMGKMIVAYSKGFKSGFSDIEISFENFAVGNSSSALNKIENSSSQKIICKGFNAKGFNEWTFNTSLSITKSSGNKIIYTDNGSRTQTSGDALALSWDNKFQHQFTSNCTTSNKIEISTSISNNKFFVKDFSCAKPYNQGIEIAHTSSFKNDIAIDFGDGSCTNNSVEIQKAYTKQTLSL